MLFFGRISLFMINTNHILTVVSFLTQCLKTKEVYIINHFGHVCE